MPDYKPGGHPNVSVYMMASDAQAVIDFAAQVLDAVELMRMARPDGSIMHAEIRIGDSLVMISQASEAYPAFPVWLHVYVPDVDATYRRALEHSAASLQEPRRGDDPDRRGGVKDPAGNSWWIATRQG